MAFLEQNGLQTGGFVCCIPRLRYTPYWKIKNQPFHPERHARNEEMKEHDMRPLRETIEAVVGQTEMKVLICPEDQSQMAVGREMLYDRLSESARKRVVWRENYWLTDEAVSVYRRSAGMFGLEMHSPIMCIGNGIPAIVSRFAEQTSKGFMWRDIGLGEWLFDFDQEADLPRLQPAVIAMIQNRQQALQMTEKARSFVQQRQIHMVNTLKEHLL
jgi:polysaccharide pyruvyl transferase WcaK-like protein